MTKRVLLIVLATLLPGFALAQATGNRTGTGSSGAVNALGVSTVGLSAPSFSATVASGSSGVSIKSGAKFCFDSDASCADTLSLSGGLLLSVAPLSAPYYLATKGGFQSTPLATPSISSITTTSTGGSLVAGTYFYRVTAIAASGGETIASSESSVVAVGGASTSKNTVTWGAVPGAVSYKLYRGGSTAEGYMVTVTAPTVSYVDTGAVAVTVPFYPTMENSGAFGGNGNSIGFASGLAFNSASPDIYLYLASNRTSGSPFKIERQNSGSNGRTLLFNIDSAGGVQTGSSLTTAAVFYSGALYVSGGTSAQHRTSGANSGSTVALQEGNSPTLTAAGAKIVGWYPDQFTTLVASVDKDGQGAFNGGVIMGASGAAITASCRATTTNPGSVGAGTCVDTSVSCSGAATGAECLVGSPTGGPGANITTSCYVSASGTVQLHACNSDSGGSHTPTAGTYSTRVFNP